MKNADVLVNRDVLSDAFNKFWGTNWCECERCTDARIRFLAFIGEDRPERQLYVFNSISLSYLAAKKLLVMVRTDNSNWPTLFKAIDAKYGKEEVHDN